MDKNRLKTARSLTNLRQGRNEWYTISNAASGRASVMIMDEIGFFGVTAEDFARDLAEISAETIDVEINSPGGDVYDALAIYNALAQHEADVNVTITGLAASAASFIAQAGDDVAIMRNAEMMIHDAVGLCVGNASDMGEMVENLNRASDNIADIYAQRADGDKAKFRELMQAETWFNAQEAVDAGLADRVLDPKRKKKDPDQAANTWDLSVFAYQGRSQAPEPAAGVDQEPSTPGIDIDKLTTSLMEAFHA